MNTNQPPVRMDDPAVTVVGSMRHNISLPHDLMEIVVKCLQHVPNAQRWITLVFCNLDVTVDMKVRDIYPLAYKEIRMILTGSRVDVAAMKPEQKKKYDKASKEEKQKMRTQAPKPPTLRDDRWDGYAFLADQLEDRKDWPEMTLVSEIFVKEVDAVRGGGPPEILTALRGRARGLLGRAVKYMPNGKPKAKKVFEEALELLKRPRGTTWIGVEDYVESMLSYADLLDKMGLFEESITATIKFMRVLHEFPTVGNGHLKLALGFGALARSYHCLGRHEEAVEATAEAEEMITKLGPRGSQIKLYMHLWQHYRTCRVRKCALVHDMQQYG